MSKKRLGIRLKDVKLALQVADEILGGVGIPAGQPLTGIALLIIDYYEVRSIVPLDQLPTEMLTSLAVNESR